MERSSIENLTKLAELLGQRSAIDREIAAILNRPVHSGHFGEYVASAIIGIALNPNAATKAHDGHFRGGPLAGRSVNVKYTTRHRGLLNLGSSTDPRHHSDFYLVLSGPKIAMGATQGTIAPLCVETVHLFETQLLLAELAARGLQPGIARSVPRSLWDAAMLFPEAHNPLLPLSQEQRDAFFLFASEAS